MDYHALQLAVRNWTVRYGFEELMKKSSDFVSDPGVLDSHGAGPVGKTRRDLPIDAVRKMRLHA